MYTHKHPRHVTWVQKNDNDSKNDAEIELPSQWRLNSNLCVDWNQSHRRNIHEASRSSEMVSLSEMAPKVGRRQEILKERLFYRSGVTWRYKEEPVQRAISPNEILTMRVPIVSFITCILLAFPLLAAANLFPRDDGSCGNGGTLQCCSSTQTVSVYKCFQDLGAR